MPDDGAKKTLSNPGKLLLGLYLALLTAGLSYFIAKVWTVVPEAVQTVAAPPAASKAAPAPQAATTSGAEPAPDAGAPAVPSAPPADISAPKSGQPEGRRTVSLFGGMIQFSMSGEIRLILLALAIGALGGCVHGATSFVGYAGNNKLYSSWTWYYIMRAPISASLALITYFVVRAGFFNASTNTGQVNDFGIAAVSGLVGMFSKQATAKLDELFSTMFRTAKPEELADKMANKLPAVSAVNPATVAHGSADTEIAVTGDGFVEKSEIHWAGSRLVTTHESATKLTATVPAERLATAGQFDVTVFSPAPGGGTSGAVKFVVT